MMERKITKKKKQELKINVIRGKVLGVEVYRGYAKLCDLASISKPDIFDQKNNPHGTQRDLSPKHAREAYAYVKNHDLAFWPEVFLCLRDEHVLQYKRSKHDLNIGNIIIDLKKINRSKNIAISRVDGNHRLHYTDGETSGYSKITRQTSFCLAYNITREEEIILFRDINDNQRRMNTSHLDNIQARLTPLEIQKIQHPDLFIAQKLGEDSKSPLFDRIYEGGKKPGYFAIPLRSLKSGISYMLSQPTKLTALPDADIQYKVIRNYFNAVKKWQPEAWNEPSKYIVLRGAGLWAICFIGAFVIDRALSDGKFNIQDMLAILTSGPIWDWSTSGDFAGYSGRGGAAKIRDKVVAEFPDRSGISIKRLAQQILESK